MSMGMGIFRRDNGFYYLYLEDRKQRFSLKTKDEAIAKQRADLIREECDNKRVEKIDRIKRIKLSKLIEEYNEGRVGISTWTTKKDSLSIKLLIEAIGDIQIRQLGIAELTKFKQNRLANGATPVTINGYLRHIKAMLRYAAEQGYLDSVPTIKMIREDKKRLAERILTEAQLRTVVEKAYAKSPEFGRFVVCVQWTGARLSEMLGALWQNVDFEAQSILLTHTKGKRDRRVPMLGPVHDVLHPVKKDVGRIFPSWSMYTVSHWFHDIMNVTGMQFRLHDLRHSACTAMLAGGGSLAVVSKIMGHASITTTMLYFHVDDEMMAQEMAKIAFKK